MSGAIANGTTVLSGGILVADNGAEMDGTVLSGVTLNVTSGVTWNGTVVGSGATETVVSGGAVTSGIVGSGGIETVLSGGVITNAMISGGELVLDQGAIVNGAITFAGSGGELLDDATGAPGNIITGMAGGDIIELASVGYSGVDPVFNSSTNELTISGTDGHAYVLQFDPNQYFLGQTFETSAGSGGSTDVYVIQTPLTGSADVPSGKTTYGVTVASGGSLNVGSGAAAIGGTVSSGGTISIGQGGSATGATVSDGGHQIVQSGGFASNTLLTDPGIQIVLSGGTASGVVVSGGEQDVYGLAISTTVMSGIDNTPGPDFRTGGCRFPVRLIGRRGQRDYR